MRKSILILYMALLLGTNLKSQQLVKNSSFENLFVGKYTAPPLSTNCWDKGIMAYGMNTVLFDSLNRGTSVYYRPLQTDSLLNCVFWVYNAQVNPGFMIPNSFGHTYLKSWSGDLPLPDGVYKQELYLGLNSPLIKNRYYVASAYFIPETDSANYNNMGSFRLGTSSRTDTIKNFMGELFYNSPRQPGDFNRWQKTAMVFKSASNDTLLALATTTAPNRFISVKFDNVQLFPAQLMSNSYSSLCSSDTITLSTSRAADHYLWNRYAPIDTNRSIQVSDTGWYVGIAFTADSAFVDSIYVGRGSVARSHQAKYCTLPITLQASFAGMPGYNWSTGQNTHRIEVHQPGTYWCAAQVSTDCIVSDSFTVSAYEMPDIPLPSDTAFCRGTSISVDATHAAYKQYQWSSGENTAFIQITDAGSYKLIATTHNDCMYEKTLKATVWELPVVNLPADTAFCPGDRQQLQLDAGIWKNYAWHPTGQTSQSIIIKDAGRYKVTITDSNNCKGSDEIIIREECPEEVYIPNAFTPDANGTNDWFEPKGRYIQSYLIQITNRWGEQVFNGSHAWDGKTQNQPAEPGVYAYEITVVMENKERRYSGTLTLLR